MSTEDPSKAVQIALIAAPIKSRMANSLNALKQWRAFRPSACRSMHESAALLCKQSAEDPLREDHRRDHIKRTAKEHRGLFTPSTSKAEIELREIESTPSAQRRPLQCNHCNAFSFRSPEERRKAKDHHFLVSRC